MKYLKNISESLNYNELSEEEFRILLNDHCKNFLSNWENAIEQSLIFRRSKDIGNLVHLNPKDSSDTRIARFAKTNYHNLLISNLESWKGYPRRNKSLICANDIRGLNHGGGNTTYLIIPLDGTMVASASTGDFWKSFPNIHDNFRNDDEDLNSWLRELLMSVTSKDTWDKVTKIIDDKNWYNMKTVLEETELSDIDIEHFFENYKGVVEYDKSKNLLKNMNNFLSPEKNKFQLLDASDTMKYYTSVYNNIIDDDGWGYGIESWIEDPVLMIKFDRYSKDEYYPKIKQFLD
ncbi:MAG: hypothetical protein SLAVMIC_00280 [uncultured marine phage]|uniref:Uncharacterized protein n=1 Tax=uncultured marine phage TaxID=707152 RepID=A0A8D9CDW1_9VIRU|nr:MAG: hypothetical protein SLAVMIC_00280 [uncultured marine phage]